MKTAWDILAWVVFTLALSAIPYLLLKESTENSRQNKVQNQMLWMLSDMQMRIYHHVAPHKGLVQFCPECFDAMRKSRARANEDKPITTLEDLEPIQ